MRDWYNKSEKAIYWPNGSVTEFSYLQNTDDVFTYQGREYEDITVDEITQHEETVFKMLRSSNRTINNKIKPSMLLTGNPGGIGHCLKGGQVLTKEGWKEISKIKVGEKVFTLDENNNLIYVKVKQVYCYDYDGEMYESNSNTVKFSCTPEHKIIRVTETKNKKGRKFHQPTPIKIKDIPSVVRLPKIGSWTGEKIGFFKIPSREDNLTRLKQPLTVSGDLFCQFMGWYLSEGNIIDRDRGFSINQIKKKNRVKIKKLLKQIGFKFNESPAGFTIYSRSWYWYLKQFGKSREIYIPKVILNADSQQQKLFFETVMLGDGCNMIYYTISKQMADDMCELGLKIGHKIYLNSRQRINRNGPCYEIKFKTNRLGWLEKKRIEKKHYKGKVYCLGIPKLHRFYIRQSGYVWLSGNSWVRRLFIDREFGENERPEDFAFVQAKIWDNAALLNADPDYINRLKDLPEDMRRAYLDGDWDIFTGQIFGEFRQKHHVIKDLIPSNTFDHYLWIDWGYSEKSACAIYLSAVIPQTMNDGRDFYRVITYKEFWGNQKHPYEWAELVFNWCNENGIHPRKCFTDPAIHSPQQSGEQSIAKLFDKKWKELNDGNFWCKCYKGSNSGNASRINRVGMMHNWLSFAGDKAPYWLICERCKWLIKTLPMLVYDENLVEAYAKGQNEHCLHLHTEVITSKGVKKLKDLLGTTGKVLSINGEWVKYSNCKKTRLNTKVVKLIFSDGSSLICTPDHKILTVHGLVEAQNLKGEKCVQLSKQQLAKSLIKLNITRAGEDIIEGMGNCFIGKFGSFIMGKLKKGWKFITGILTKIIIKLKTLLSLKDLNTGCFMVSFLRPRQNYLNTLIKLGAKQKRGTNLRREDCGIKNILKKCEINYLRKNLALIVLFVGKALNRLKKKLSSALQNAVQKIVEIGRLTILKKPVLFAETYSAQTNMTIRKPVLLNAEVSCEKVIWLKKRVDTACLTADKYHVFSIDNGIIISNSADSCTYGLSQIKFVDVSTGGKIFTHKGQIKAYQRFDKDGKEFPLDIKAFGNIREEKSWQQM